MALCNYKPVGEMGFQLRSMPRNIHSCVESGSLNVNIQERLKHLSERLTLIILRVFIPLIFLLQMHGSVIL